MVTITGYGKTRVIGAIKSQTNTYSSPAPPDMPTRYQPGRIAFRIVAAGQGVAFHHRCIVRYELTTAAFGKAYLLPNTHHGSTHGHRHPGSIFYCVLHETTGRAIQTQIQETLILFPTPYSNALEIQPQLHRLYRIRGLRCRSAESPNRENQGRSSFLRLSHRTRRSPLLHVCRTQQESHRTSLRPTGAFSFCPARPGTSFPFCERRCNGH